MPWSEPATLALIAVMALAASAAGTAWARRYGLRGGLIDAPGERRSHAVPTPRGGGIGIAVVGLACLISLGAVVDRGWWWVAAGLLLVVGAGWWDDHRSVSPLLRLVLHALAGGALATALVGWNAPPLQVAAGFLLVASLVNVWNFMDGIDGLAASQGALCALGLGLLAGGSAQQMLAAATVAACVGFLPFNVPRARVFLGDVGSGAIGYLLAVLLACAVLDRPASAWGLLLLPVSAFLVDAAMTLGWRALRRERWWTPHVQHLYQRASRRYGHARVTLAYAVWTIAVIAVMLVAIRSQLPMAWIASGAVLMAAVATWTALHRRWSGATEGLGA